MISSSYDQILWNKQTPTAWLVELVMKYIMCELWEIKQNKSIMSEGIPEFLEKQVLKWGYELK